MMFKTHLVFGFLAGLIMLNFFNFDNKGLFLILVLFFSLVPDIDEPGSKFGRKVKPLSYLINIVFGHRGVMHSLFIPWIIAGVFFILGFGFVGVAVLIGYFSHLLIDGLTIGGVNLLTPFSRLRIKGFVRTGGIFEWIFFVLVIVGIIYLVSKSF